ncbi:MAG TPA: SDR family oxidoreductase [Acidimicrobiia bacterium]|nr:SDR family oxidoreductase [Acidimicrobiia bacterium]
MDLGLNGKRAAVAAASQGLGRATAAALASEGVTVAICGRSRERIDAAAAEIPGAIPLVADVGTEEGAAAFVRAAHDALGGVDILVANGGGPPAGTFASTDLAAYRTAIEQNCLSVVAMCTEAVPAMQAQGWGRVLAITSISVRQPIATLILSNTARAGLTGFLKTLAREVAADGVTVNSIQPGTHDTERIRALHGAGTDLSGGAIGRPDDFGRVAAFLCSDAARFVNGAALNVDGGAFAGLQ